MPQLAWINPDDPPDAFPDPRSALREPDGLLAAGGDLSPARLLCAYRRGIFPWYSADQPILWWCPDPRAVLFPDTLHISRSLRKNLRQRHYEVTFDRAFADVMLACAGARRNQPVDGTWITDEMRAAYHALHQLGHAHSVEVWMDGQLAGGLYGIAMGNVFFGESMFSRRTAGSKIALAWLTRQLRAWDFQMIDCQVTSQHLSSLGSIKLPRNEFLTLLETFATRSGHSGRWQFEIAPEF
ncbi:MAG TPA: leucyl/phenylalanyl-tRNA--protein transferase [Gammaproteobacteria bacterium]|nr:leucyl/phenylalanyl-tRNA--protein transferase [Gammaproteobacteria bacterium]